MKEPGCDAKKREQKHYQFLIPSLEIDCSEEANSDIISRSSTAIMGKDSRLG